MNTQTLADRIDAVAFLLLAKNPSNTRYRPVEGLVAELYAAKSDPVALRDVVETMHAEGFGNNRSRELLAALDA